MATFSVTHYNRGLKALCYNLTGFILQDLGSKDVSAEAYLVAHIVRVGM